MDDQSRSTWSQMSPSVKSKIVKSVSPNLQAFTPNTSSFPKKGVGNRNINLHETSLYDLLANFHVSNDQSQVSTDDTITTTDVETTANTTNNETTSQDNDQLLIQAVKSSGSNTSKPSPLPSDIRSLLSKKNTRSGNVHELIYKVSAHDSKSDVSLVDRGANGGIAGSDVRVIEMLHRSVDVQGIDNHKMENIPIVTAGRVTKTQRGEVILILNQYAYVCKGTSIHSSPQIEAYNNKVDDRAIKVGGK